MGESRGSADPVFRIAKFNCNRPELQRSLCSSSHSLDNSNPTVRMLERFRESGPTWESAGERLGDRVPANSSVFYQTTYIDCIGFYCLYRNLDLWRPFQQVQKVPCMLSLAFAACSGGPCHADLDSVCLVVEPLWDTFWLPPILDTYSGYFFAFEFGFSDSSCEQDTFNSKRQGSRAPTAQSRG
mgnify:CR=1 FL=1